jgi:hypothetical protein
MHTQLQHLTSCLPTAKPDYNPVVADGIHHLVEDENEVDCS